VVCRLTEFDSLCSLPHILHAGLSYNPITSFPAPALLSSLTSLKSLDISHCDLTNLHSTLQAIELITNLQVVSLAGNPFCLLPTYQQTVKERLPKKVTYKAVCLLFGYAGLKDSIHEHS
jgi:Leucine-rich repeat (LRR) protein